MQTEIVGLLSKKHILWISLVVFSMFSCNYPTTTGPSSPNISLDLEAENNSQVTLAAPPSMPSTRSPDDPLLSPTPDSPHLQPTLRSDAIRYVVQPNDTLGQIANQFGVAWEWLASVNQLIDPNQLEVGQVLNIPPASPEDIGPDTKILPDSELVYGPAAIYLDVIAFSEAQGGYLNTYREEVNNTFQSGPEIVALVATEYSINPKVLLTILEFQSGWVRDSNPRTNTLEFPLGLPDSYRLGLYRQLSWTADRLNKNFYEWKSGLTAGWYTLDNAFIPASPTINAGTAAVQGVFALLYAENQWRETISDSGFIATYTQLFSYPFDFAIEPLIPSDLSLPNLQLPFESGVPWVYTGGPHSGWGEGSAWAALDFVPRGDQLGCNQSNDWVVAAADGVIVRSDNGAVVQDLDGDGFEQSGWTILYMHIAEFQRVATGDYLYAGERVGHPSCEGGVASASHLHLARRYNGEWIPAFGALPFIMDGWVSKSSGTLYDGYLERDGQVVVACECRDPQYMLER